MEGVERGRHARSLADGPSSPSAVQSVSSALNLLGSPSAEGATEKLSMDTTDAGKRAVVRGCQLSLWSAINAGNIGTASAEGLNLEQPIAYD